MSLVLDSLNAVVMTVSRRPCSLELLDLYTSLVLGYAMYMCESVVVPLVIYSYSL